MNFLGTCFEIINIVLLIKSLSTISSIHWWFWPESIMVIAKWWFFNTVFPSSINCFPLVDLPFSLSIGMDALIPLLHKGCNLFLSLFILMLKWSWIWPAGTPSSCFYSLSFIFFYSRILLVIYFNYSRVYMLNLKLPIYPSPPPILPAPHPRPYSFDISL